ncbi:unnamed protein product [Lathyrus sativus]|nr:unnamed protein product [Lathyrus sativus]
MNLEKSNFFNYFYFSNFPDCLLRYGLMLGFVDCVFLLDLRCVSQIAGFALRQIADRVSLMDLQWIRTENEFGEIKFPQLFLFLEFSRLFASLWLDVRVC